MCTEKCLELTRGVTRRGALLGGAAVAASAVLQGTAHAGERGNGERGAGFLGKRRGLRDLTHPLTTSFPAFAPGEEAVRRTVVTIEDDGYYMQEWRIIEHIGTHVDAPGHFTPGGRLATELELPELITPAVVIDIADRAARDPDMVTVDDLRAFERRHGRIPRDAAVLMHSGWAAKDADADAYRGADATGTLRSPASGPRPASGSCAAGGSAASGSTPSASTRATRRPSTPTRSSPGPAPTGWRIWPTSTASRGRAPPSSSASSPTRRARAARPASSPPGSRARPGRAT
jgi:Putative cyclase